MGLGRKPKKLGDRERLAWRAPCNARCPESQEVKGLQRIEPE